MEAEGAPPEGFVRHFRQSPLTQPWEPLYSRRTDGAVVIGLWAREAHCNSRGFVHGGLISALADNAMGLTCATRIGNGASLVTINLALDYMGVARIGQWLAFETGFVRLGGSLCFTDLMVRADGEACAKASGVFRRTDRAAA